MSIQLNVRDPQIQVGQAIERSPETVLSGFIKADSVATFAPAVGVVIAGSENGVMVFEKALATSKDIYFIKYEVGKTVYGVSSLRDRGIAAMGSENEMYMTAGAAITAGARLEIVPASNKVITNAGINTVIGIALSNANANGDVIRVKIKQI